MPYHRTLLVKIPYAVRKRLGTRRHSVTVTICPDGVTVTSYPPYWDGGSRTQTWRLDRNGRTEPVDYGRQAAWPARPRGVEVEVTHGTAMIEGGTFCGKPAHLHIYATADWLHAMGVEIDA